MVFFSHLSFLKNSNYEFLKYIFDKVFSEGHIGVSFFFILSGFILSYNYQDSFLKKSITNKKFYTARIARILPLHILTLLLALPLSYDLVYEHAYLWIGQIVTNLTLTQSYIPFEPIYYSLNAPSWSISAEMFFYFSFPFLIFLASRYRKHKYFLFFLLIAVIPVLTLIIPDNYSYWSFYINPFIRILDFVLGIIVFNGYRLFLRKEIKVNYDFLEISAVILLVVFFIFNKGVGDLWRYSFYYWIPMVYLIFCFSFQKGFLSKILSKRLFIHLGEISFGFYMFHQLVIRYFDIFNSYLQLTQNHIIITVLLISISSVVSHYSFLFFEKPLYNYIKKVKPI